MSSSQNSYFGKLEKRLRGLAMGTSSLNPVHVFASCFGIASLAGIAHLLRSGQELTVRTVVAAGLYSGAMGTVIGLLWYNYFISSNIYFLIGVSGLAGLGGVSLIDVITQIISKGGVNIIVRPKQHELENPSEADQGD